MKQTRKPHDNAPKHHQPVRTAWQQPDAAAATGLAHSRARSASQQVRLPSRQPDALLVQHCLGY